MSTEENHDLHILDQFSRQAAPFARRHRADLELIDLLIESSSVNSGDHVLDVACGPGIVACALAPHAGHVTGLDFTPAMLEQAAALQTEKRLGNLDWRQGTAIELPFQNATFDLVVTRFSFHHYRDPVAAFREMVRVCRPGGRVLVADVAPRVDAREAYDALEKLRDPSHTRALTEDELAGLSDSTAGVQHQLQKQYNLESDVEGLLESSFPAPGGAAAFRAAVESDVAGQTDKLGIGAHHRHGLLWFYFPVLILLWKREEEREDSR